MALLAVASIKQGPSRDQAGTSIHAAPLFQPHPTSPIQSTDQKTSHGLLLTLEVSVVSGYPFSRLSDRLMAWIMPFLPLEAGRSRPSWPPRFPVVIALPSLLGAPQSLLLRRILLRISTEYAFLTSFLCALQYIVAIVRILSFGNFRYPLVPIPFGITGGAP